MKDGTKAKFKVDGFAYEIAQDLDMDLEVIENLDGANIIVQNEACDGYYDVSFPGYYDADGDVLVMSALSDLHIKQTK